jgi:hypothetical protein
MPLNIPQNNDIFPTFLENMAMASSNQKELRRQDLANLYQSLQNERYGAMTPHEVDIKALEAARANAMNAPDALNSYKLGQIGQYKTQAATGDFDEAILKDKIQAEIAAKRSAMSKSQFEKETTELESLHRGLQVAIPELERIPPGVMRNQRAMQLAAQIGLDPKAVGMIISNGGINDIENLKSIYKSIGFALESSTKHRQEMGKEKLKSDTSIQVANIQANAHLGAAAMRQKDEEAARKSAWLKMSDTQRASFIMQLITQAEEAGQSSIDLPDGSMSVAKAKEYVNKVQAQALAIANARGQQVVDVNQMTRGAVPVVKPGANIGYPNQSQQQQPTSYEVGKVYEGTTGKYKYKGGDPKNTSNWEKVK